MTQTLLRLAGRLMLALLFIVLLALLLIGLLVFRLGTNLIDSQHRPIGPPPAELDARVVNFEGVRGWYVPAKSDACVLLLHGMGGDRRSMVARAMLLRRHGYPSLAIDMPGHGESPGRVSFGLYESRGAHTALRGMREQLGCKRVAAVGQSLGGAAALLGEQPLPADALILEAVYPDIESAARRRMRASFGRAGDWLTPLLLLQLEPRLGVSTEQLRPIDQINRYHGPVLVMGGDKDRATPIADTLRLYRAAGEPRYFWAVPGAGHVDLLEHAPLPYATRLLHFLHRHLREPERLPADS